MASFTFGYGGAYGYRGSLSLAQILYQTSLGDFTYNTDSSGNVVLTNQGNLGTSYDGLLYSSRFIELGATNDVDIPIHHTLGADKDVQAFSATVGDDTGSASVLGQIATFNINGTGTQAGGAVAEWRDSPFVIVPANTTYKIIADIVITSGAFKPHQFRYGELTVGIADIGLIEGNEYTSSFTHTFEFTTGNEASLSQPFFYSYNTVAGSYTIEVQSIQQITNPNSYLTYYDFTDGFTYVDCSTLTPSTTYNIVSKTINNVLTHTTAWNATDKSKIENNPNLVGKLALSGTGTIPEVDLTLVAGDEYYMCSEKSGAYIVDSRTAYGSTIVTNGTFDTDTDWTKGTGWTIAAGVASSDGTQVADSLLTTSTVPTTVAGSTYLVSFEVTAYTAGNVALQFDGVEIIPDKAALGTYYAIATASDTTGTIDVVADLNFVGSVDNVTAQLVSSIPIANYASTIRTNADLQQKGIQTTAFVTDGAGVPTSFTGNILNFTALEYIDTQWNPSLETEFWIEEVIAGVVYQHKYDGTNLTTYTDNVAGTPALHSPENASYLLGKGVYPKVTADPYTSYQAKTFAVYTGSRYTSYDQSARYTILAAL